MKIIKYTIFSILVCLILTTSACKDFVDLAPPKDQVSAQVVYNNDETAISAIRGIYAQMMTANFASGGDGSVTLNCGKSADEFINYAPGDNYQEFSTNNLSPTNTALRTGLWQAPYKYIYYANAILENLEKSDNVTSSTKTQLIGEAKFIRAFCHFYLTNLFGEVPLILTTDYRVNSVVFASKKDEIYAQIIKDLIDAKELLKEAYPSSERIRANKWAATALLARVYLYNNNWEKAIEQSSEVISKIHTYKILDDLNQVFLKNNQESILQFAPVIPSINTNEGSIFILTAAPGATTQVVLNTNLVEAFEPGDKRLTNWVGTFVNGTSSWQYSYKYKQKTGTTIRSEYSVVLRLAEQYLIRAEARINQGEIELGIADLNVIRKRARPLPTISNPDPLPATSLNLNQENALLAVERERRVELFSEWGHRWLDLKRTNRVDQVLGPIKFPNWKNSDSLYPIPFTELNNNPNLNQNLGYE